jgi:hypothetical protein
MGALHANQRVQGATVFVRTAWSITTWKHAGTRR